MSIEHHFEILTTYSIDRAGEVIAAHHVEQRERRGTRERDLQPRLVHLC